MNYNFYLIDDDKSVISILSKIIVSQNLGDVVGQSYEGLEIIQDIKRLNPDIVIVDLLLPHTDGISIVKKMKALNPQLPLVMISEVHAKEMVSKAYDAGVEFYINKPINVIEVVNVIERIDETLRLKQVVSSFQTAFQSMKALDDLSAIESPFQSSVEKSKQILSELGIMSESGAKDILNVISFLDENDHIHLLDMKLSDLYHFLSIKYEKEQGEIINEKTIEQRIRRSIAQAFDTLCQLGLENYGNIYFERYGTTLFDFKEVRREMNYIKTGVGKRGKINIRKFIMGLLNEI